MNCRLEAWHPSEALRWSNQSEVDLPVDPDAPLPNWPGLASLRPFHGENGWVLRFRHAKDALLILLCTDAPPWPGHWEEAETPASRAPWSLPAWRRDMEAWIHRHVGPHTLHQHRVWGRSTIWRVEAGETLWFKESYGLPPGEGAALRLAARHHGSLTVPRLVGVDGTRALMEPLAGVDLRERPACDWTAALQAVLAFAHRAHITEWVAAGARDLRSGWHERLTSLFAEYGFDSGHADDYASWFDGLNAVVLPQDLGPCNLRWLGEGRVQGFDWSDVVISIPGMILQRFLNEARHRSKTRGNGDYEALMSAFGGSEGRASTVRCARLHETWRYHEELAWLDEDEPLAIRLREGNARQLERLVASEGRS
jgi:hypothetical protein